MYVPYFFEKITVLLHCFCQLMNQFHIHFKITFKITFRFFMQLDFSLRIEKKISGIL